MLNSRQDKAGGMSLSAEYVVAAVVDEMISDIPETVSHMDICKRDDRLLAYNARSAEGRDGRL